jgi:hypothetical protein
MGGIEKWIALAAILTVHFDAMRAQQLPSIGASTIEQYAFSVGLQAYFYGYLLITWLLPELVGLAELRF